MQCHESVGIKPIPNAIVSAITAYKLAAKAVGHAIDAERCCQADGLVIAEFVEAAISEWWLIAIDDESPTLAVVANAAALTECDNVAVTDGDGWLGGSPGGTWQRPSETIA
jgi:hypothetical protein